MKKIQSTVLFAGLLLSTHFAYAQSADFAGVGQMTEAPAKAGLFARIMAYQPGPALARGGRALMQTSVQNAGKAVVICAESKVACATGAATLATLSYLYAHPELVDEYLQNHPDQYDTVNNYLAKRQAQAQNAEQVEKYSNVQDAISASTIVDQDNLEATPDFQAELAKVTTLADSIDLEMQKETQGCSIEVTKNLMLSSAEFNKTVNVLLPKINDGRASEFNVDKYSNLKGKLNILERDHIPSYKAIEYYLQNNNINLTSLKSLDNRYSNLANNETALNLSFNIHRNNRTTGNKNATYSVFDGKDQLSLRLATLKDFATILVLSKIDISQYQKYLNAFPVVYERNKLLCLYN